jgi:hypothetical protein
MNRAIFFFFETFLIPPTRTYKNEPILSN